MPEGLLESAQWIEFRNDNAGTVPAYGVMRVTGVVVIEPGRVALTCDKPNTFGCQANCVINGPIDVPPAVGSNKSYGICMRSGTLVGLYDDAATPAYGDIWGPVNASWKLTKNSGGYFSLGDPTNTTLKIAMFAPLPMLSFYGQNAGAQIAKGSTGTINIFTGPLGSETDSGETMPDVLARFGAIAAGAMVDVKFSEMTSGTSPSWYAMEMDACAV